MAYAARTRRLVERTARPAASTSNSAAAPARSIPTLRQSKPFDPCAAGEGETGLGVFPADWIAWATCCETPPGTYALRLYE